MTRCALSIALVLASTSSAADLFVDGGTRPLDLSEHAVVADVDNRLALTRVQQVFVNASDRRLEGVYVFPVPPGASLVDFAMWVGGRKVRAAVVEKQAGRRIYESYKIKGRDPALLEHVARNVFQVKVFPIEPRSEVRIELVYREVVEYDGGLCRYVYPVRSSQGAGVTTGRFRLEVRVRSEIPIRSVVAQSEGGMVEVRSEREASVVFERAVARIAEDFAVLYRLGGEATRVAWIAHRASPEADGHFLLVVSPDESEAGPIVTKDMTFVVDVSGSMAGEKLTQAKRALRHCVHSLGAGDRFDVLAFSDDVRSFGGGLVAADPAHRDRALVWIDALEPTGGTAIDAALGQALARKGDGRPHLVVFLTDGMPTVGERDPRRIVEHVRSALAPGTRVYTFGIGTPSDYDRDLLDAIARESGGAHEAVGPTEDVEFKVSRFQAKVAHPVLVDLALDWGGAPVKDVQPLRLPPLFRGSQLLVLGRFTGSGPYRVALTGLLGDRAVRLEAPIEFPDRAESHPAVPSLWAAGKVDSLLYEMKVGGEAKELVDEVVRLALEHRLATPYTSFLVLENEEEFRRWNLTEGGSQAPPPAVESIEADHDESEDAVSNTPFRGKSTNSAIGLGGGSGGSFGGRSGGRESLVTRNGGSVRTQSSVGLGLEWLDRHQDRTTGRWDSDDFQARCRQNTCSGRGAEDADTAQTGLALLAFLGAGNTHHTGTYKATVLLALRALLDAQDAEGCFGPRTGRWLWAHEVATLAMVEAYGMTQSPLLVDGARRAVRFLADARSAGRGWGDGWQPAETDAWHTGWAALVLKSARVSGLDVPAEALADTTAALDGGGETGKAIRVVAHLFRGADRAGPFGAAANDLSVPAWTAANPETIDYRYLYWGTLATFQSGSDPWKSWNAALKACVVPCQRAEGDERGSWDPIGPAAAEGGRIEATALSVLSLEVYYRYDRMSR